MLGHVASERDMAIFAIGFIIYPLFMVQYMGQVAFLSKNFTLVEYIANGMALDARLIQGRITTSVVNDVSPAEQCQEQRLHYCHSYLPLFEFCIDECPKDKQTIMDGVSVCDKLLNPISSCLRDANWEESSAHDVQVANEQLLH